MDVQDITTPTYDYWHAALRGEFGPVHDGDAQPGFWRRRISRGGAFVPVAIWWDGSRLVAIVDGREADPAELWSYCCRYPVTEAAYHHRVKTGHWPDESEAVAASLEPPPVGHNGPPTDPVEILSAQIDAALGGVGRYAEIGDDETAAQAQSLRSRLLELSGSADKERETEKRPILEAGRAIDKKWKPLVDKAKEGADLIRKALGAFETRKEQARRAAEAARLKAEAEAAAARAKAEAAGKPAPQCVAPPQPMPVPAPTTTVRGAYGRAASIKVVKVATVTDAAAFYVHIASMPETVEYLATMAKRLVKAGFTPPGVTITEEREVS